MRPAWTAYPSPTTTPWATIASWVGALEAPTPAPLTVRTAPNAATFRERIRTVARTVVFTCFLTAPSALVLTPTRESFVAFPGTSCDRLWLYEASMITQCSVPLRRHDENVARRDGAHDDLAHRARKNVLIRLR